MICILLPLRVPDTLRLVAPLALSFVLAACAVGYDAPDSNSPKYSKKESEDQGLDLLRIGRSEPVADTYGGGPAPAIDDPQYQEYLRWKEWQEFKRYQEWKEKQAGGAAASAATQSDAPKE